MSDSKSQDAIRRRWLHRRSWVRQGSPLQAFLLMVDGATWFALKVSRGR